MTYYDPTPCHCHPDDPNCGHADREYVEYCPECLTAMDPEEVTCERCGWVDETLTEGA